MKRLLQSPWARALAAALFLFAWDAARRASLYSRFTAVIGGRIGSFGVVAFYLAVLASLAAVLSGIGRLGPRRKFAVLATLFLWMTAGAYFRLSVHRSLLPDDFSRAFYLDHATWRSFLFGLNGPTLAWSLFAAFSGTAGLTLILRYFPRPVRWFVPAAGLLAQVLLWSYTQLTFHLAHLPVEPLSDFVRSTVYTAREYYLFASVPRETLHARQPAATPTQNILFIVDESIRADAIPTFTPYLRRELVGKPGFHDYGPAVAAATCSIEAKTILLTGVERFPDRELRARRNPTIWDLAKSAGYRTWLLDAQHVNFPNHAIRDSDLARVDRVVPNAQIPDDIAAAHWLHDELSKERGVFAVLFKSGAHEPYGSRYPRAGGPRALRLPQMPPSQIRSSDLTTMRNTYGNAVEYTVDYFFETLRPTELPSLTLVYTSDHGENLGERGAAFGHCATGAERAKVPLFIYAGGAFPKPTDPIARSQFQLYPMWQTWFGVTPTSRFPSLDLASSPPPELFYVTGSLWLGTETVPVSSSDILAN